MKIGRNNVVNSKTIKVCYCSKKFMPTCSTIKLFLYLFLLKETVAEPTKSGESQSKGSIRGQQIIDHIIENLLTKNSDVPSPSGEAGGSVDTADLSNSSTNGSGMNNNADSAASGQDNSDRIKASIYESLKNGLLKDKNHSGSKPGDLPFKNLKVGPSRVSAGGKAAALLVGEEATRLPSESAAVKVSSVHTNANLNKSPGGGGANGVISPAALSPNPSALPLTSSHQPPSTATAAVLLSSGGATIRSPSKPLQIVDNKSTAAVLIANSQVGVKSGAPAVMHPATVVISTNHLSPTPTAAVSHNQHLLRPASAVDSHNNSSAIMRLMSQQQHQTTNHLSTQASTIVNNNGAAQLVMAGVPQQQQLNRSNEQNLGRTSVTITRTPRQQLYPTANQPQQLIVSNTSSPNNSLLSTSFLHHEKLNSQAPTSLTLTPATIQVTAVSPQHYSGGASATAIRLPVSPIAQSKRSPGNVHQYNHSSGSTTVLPVTVAPSGSMQHSPTTAASLKHYSPQSYSFKQSQPSTATLIIPQPTNSFASGRNNAGKFNHHQQGNNQLLIAVTTSSSPMQHHQAVVTAPSMADCGAVNLSVKRPSEDDMEGGGRGSARSCKGKRYQEFIEDGRITVGGGSSAIGGGMVAKKRRSHRSGDNSSEETALNLSTTGGKVVVNGGVSVELNGYAGGPRTNSGKS